MTVAVGRRGLFAALFAAAAALTPASGRAHVGSTDVFFEDNAGPYRLLITIQPPEVVPGVADIQIRSDSDAVREIRIAPVPLAASAEKFSPIPDVASRSADDPRFFSGHLWLMTTGSWQVRLWIEGSAGGAQLAVPVPALPVRTARMQRTLGAFLLALLLILCAGLVSIVGAAAREGQVPPGAPLSDRAKRRARWLTLVAAGIVLAVVLLGNWWWKDEAQTYARYIYKPLQMSASVEGGSLKLHLGDPGWLRWRKVDDLVPDHEHLMHLFIIREPQLDRIWHLHPTLVASGAFSQPLPSMPAGKYRLFADVVHENGLAETAVAELQLPETRGAPLGGDDSEGGGPPFSAPDPNGTSFPLVDGGRVIWDREPGPLRAKRVAHFTFRVEDAAGQPASDLQLYMGMLGHAAFVKRDLSVFAHVHPSGSVPMPALALASGHPSAPSQPHQQHAGGHGALPAVISFPFGLPQAGDYRVFVQLKRRGVVETAVFDARVHSG